MPRLVGSVVVLSWDYRYGLGRHRSLSVDLRKRENTPQTCISYLWKSTRCLWLEALGAPIVCICMHLLFVSSIPQYHRKGVEARRSIFEYQHAFRHAQWVQTLSLVLVQAGVRPSTDKERAPDASPKGLGY